MEGQLLEKKDCTKQVQEALPQAKTLADAGKLTEAIELLLGVEKQARLGNDIANLKEVVMFTVKLCREKNDWEQLTTTLTVISKRRQQNKAVITGMVQESMGYLDQAPSKDVRLALITTLRDITDGKIFVEAERARLTKMLSKMKEEEGKVAEACDILQDVHVETYGSLDKKEKLEFLLEQIRLTLAKKDFIRTLIISRKVTKKLLEGEDMQELKVKFYRLMIEYHSVHEKSAFDLSQDYHSIYDTPYIKEDPQKWQEALKSCIIFLILSPHSNQQNDMLHRVYRDERVKEIPVFKDVLKIYTTHEIIGYPLKQQAEIESHNCINEFGSGLKEFCFEELRTRVIQHNIRVLSRYYKRVRLTRASELLSLSKDELEKNIATLVSDGNLYARIDRPHNEVVFAKPKTAEETLSDWAADVSQLLGLMEKTTHLINKELMGHKI